MTKSSDLVKTLYDDFGRGDVPAVLGAFDPQIQWREAEGFAYAEHNPYIGPKAVAEGVFGRIVGDVEGFRVNSERYIDAGDTVIVEGRYGGTWKATGTAIDAAFAHIWQLKGGKVVRFHQYTDTKQWAQAAEG